MSATTAEKRHEKTADSKTGRPTDRTGSKVKIEQVNLETMENLEAVRAQRAHLKKSADTKILDSLVEIGFNVNTWSFEPKYIRRLLQVASFAFGVFSAVSWYQRDQTTFGLYRWMFTCYEAVFVGLLYFWYSSVEHGGGRFLFSPGWRDSYVLTDSTSTNYVVKIHVGYEDIVEASIPFSSFEVENDGSVDHYWLADELETQLSREILLKK